MSRRTIKPYLDPAWYSYRSRWQSAFSQRAKTGPAHANHARHYVSILRVMRRRLLAGGKPSLLDFRPSRKAPPEEFILKSSYAKLRRAIDRGEPTKVIRRRGLLDPMGRHRAYLTTSRPKRS